MDRLITQFTATLIPNLLQKIPVYLWGDITVQNADQMTLNGGMITSLIRLRSLLMQLKTVF